MELRPFVFTDPAQIAATTALWNAACGPDLAITGRAMTYNTAAIPGGVQAGMIAIEAGGPAGFVLASALPHDPSVSPPEAGWVDAIAVYPDFQRRGIGTALLGWAEGWLADQGCRKARLGGNIHPFAAGLPVQLGSEAFFARHGFAATSGREHSWDVAHDLADYTTPPSALKATGRQFKPSARAARPGEEDALLAFLRREFPGRWRFEAECHLREGGRISDYVLLFSDRGVDGFCQLTYEDSRRPLDRFFPYNLPKPWGQLGSVGVSWDRHGQGYGAVMMDAALHHMRNQGIRGCVIDWTGIVDFYAKFGFKLYRQYWMAGKTLGA
jgi:GNAT superfamily N-acetyltransferase